MTTAYILICIAILGKFLKPVAELLIRRDELRINSLKDVIQTLQQHIHILGNHETLKQYVQMREETISHKKDKGIASLRDEMQMRITLSAARERIKLMISNDDQM